MDNLNNEIKDLKNKDIELQETIDELKNTKLQWLILNKKREV